MNVGNKEFNNLILSLFLNFLFYCANVLSKLFYLLFIWILGEENTVRRSKNRIFFIGNNRIQICSNRKVLHFIFPELHILKLTLFANFKLFLEYFPMFL